MEARAAIIGVSGPVLTPDEAALFAAHPPAGAILFTRNVADPAQLRCLMADIRAVLSHGAVIMVDQEGGRVARLRPPHWRAHPAAARIGDIPDLAIASRAAWLTGALIGIDCAEAGFDVACAPVLDLLRDGASDIVGDRSFGADPARVAALGRAMAEGLLAAGIQPVGKHAPGHGRACLDTHHALPTVPPCTLDDDIAPFAALADLPWMMTAHVIFAGLDPGYPATLSRAVIEATIRGGIGFAGVLVSDDLAMGALSGPPERRALAALAAGCDIALYCPGDSDGNVALLESVPPLTPIARHRLADAAALARHARMALDGGELERERDFLLP